MAPCSGPEKSSDHGVCVLPCAVCWGSWLAGKAGGKNPRTRQSERYNPDQYFPTCLAVTGSECQLEYVQQEGFAVPSRSGM